MLHSQRCQRNEVRVLREHVKQVCDSLLWQNQSAMAPNPCRFQAFELPGSMLPCNKCQHGCQRHTVGYPERYTSGDTVSHTVGYTVVYQLSTTVDHTVGYPDRDV